jgi:tetratricopeptide (TPR) repeat protein
MLAHYGGPFSKLLHGRSIFPFLRKAQSLRPDSPEVLFGLGSFYLLAPVIVGGDRNKAEDYLKRAIERDPLFADAYVRLGQLYGSRGDEKSYAAYIAKALQIDPLNELALDDKSGDCKYICVQRSKQE